MRDIRFAEPGALLGVSRMGGSNSSAQKTYHAGGDSVGNTVGGFIFASRACTEADSTERFPVSEKCVRGGMAS